MDETARQGLRALWERSDRSALGPQRRPGAQDLKEIRSAFRTWVESAVVSRSLLGLLESAVLLRHDHLDASHTLSQSIGSAEGSFLHGIMHRREPDYSNAKYWFHRVGDHPIFPDLREAALNLGLDATDPMVSGSEWDPDAFVDAVEKVLRRQPDPERLALLESIQEAELDLLVSHCISRH